VSSKLATYERILTDHSLADSDVAYMGDDVVDLAVLARVGLSIAPADCVDEVRARAHWVVNRPGGAGAAREVIERILRVQGLWQNVVDAYLNEPSEVGSTTK